MALIQLSIHKQKHGSVLKTFSLKAVKCRFLDGPLFWKMLFHINEKSMRAPFFSFYLKTFFFFVRKMTKKKGQNKSPIILTKIKALLSVQEQSWNLLSWWQEASSSAFARSPQFIDKLHPDAVSSAPSPHCFSAAARLKVRLRGTNPSSICPSWETPTRTVLVSGVGKRRQRCGIKQKRQIRTGCSGCSCF